MIFYAWWSWSFYDIAIIVYGIRLSPNDNVLVLFFPFLVLIFFGHRDNTPLWLNNLLL